MKVSYKLSCDIGQWETAYTLHKNLKALLTETGLQVDITQMEPTPPRPYQIVVGYTDGACRKTGQGGWAYAIVEERPEGFTYKTASGHAGKTTNNQMEMTAVLELLKATPEGCRVIIYADSQYVINGLTEWRHTWEARGWRTSTGDPVKNADLWKQLGALYDARQVRFRWIRGHAGDTGNELVDKLANAESQK